MFESEEKQIPATGSVCPATIWPFKSHKFVCWDMCGGLDGEICHRCGMRLTK